MAKKEDSWKNLPGVKVPFDWKAFIDKHKILYRHHGGFKAVAGPLAFRVGLLAMGQLGWFLDELMYPHWRRADMRGPIFILGHQRSGTTFLHRLLDKDKTHARSLVFHEMLLPATSIQNGLSRLAEWDKGRGGFFKKKFAAVQEKKFGPLDHIHRLRFDEVEEDEFVLWAIYASAMCVNDSPISTADKKLDELRHFDSWSKKRKTRALGWYRACLLKKVEREPAKSENSTPWCVSKNPAFTQKIPELVKVFPHARFVYLVRNPLETIPSRLSLIQSIWRHRFPGFDRMSQEQIDVILKDSVKTYLGAQQDLVKVPKRKKIVVTYDELLQKPEKVVLEIYSHFKLPGPDNALNEYLGGLKRRNRTHKSKHDYSLSQFGVDKKDITMSLKKVFSAYGF